MPNASTGAVTMATGTGSYAVGVCAQSAVSGEMVTVITNGIVNVANDDDTTSIAAGKFVKLGSFGGVLLASTGDVLIGMTLDVIAGGGYGRVKLINGGL